MFTMYFWSKQLTPGLESSKSSHAHAHCLPSASKNKLSTKNHSKLTTDTITVYILHGTSHSQLKPFRIQPCTGSLVVFAPSNKLPTNFRILCVRIIYKQWRYPSPQRRVATMRVLSLHCTTWACQSQRIVTVFCLPRLRLKLYNCVVKLLVRTGVDSTSLSKVK